jgi:hypothetical protein
MEQRRQYENFESACQLLKGCLREWLTTAEPADAITREARARLGMLLDKYLPK